MTLVAGLVVFAAIWFVVDKATRDHPGRKARDGQLDGPWPTPGEQADSGGWGGEDHADGDDGGSGDSGGESGGDGGGD